MLQNIYSIIIVSTIFLITGHLQKYAIGNFYISFILNYGQNKTVQQTVVLNY